MLLKVGLYGPIAIGVTLAELLLLFLLTLVEFLHPLMLAAHLLYIVGHFLCVSLILCHQVQVLLLGHGSCSWLCGSFDGSPCFCKERRGWWWKWSELAFTLFFGCCVERYWKHRVKSVVEGFDWVV